MPEEVPKTTKFMLSSLSGCMATVIVQPMDLVKNRMQVSGEGGGAKTHKSSFHAIRNILANEGFLAFYNGLGAGLLRQVMYTGTRLGIYTSLFSHFTKNGKPPGFAEKMGIAATAGSIGAFVGTPAELCLIRMTTDKSLPETERRNYKNVFDAIFRVTREEGVTTLWRGCGPTVGRAVVVNIAQLVSYSQCKEMLIKKTDVFKEGILTHFVASMISALVTTVASLPVDIAKTRLQKMKIVDGVPEYKGFVDVFSRIVKKEGVFALWKGFTPYYARLGPHTVLTFIFLEQLLNVYKKAKGIESKSASL
ncbi:mitochondrial 2-oxoglutarate/malate carrier protein-like [Symsagittifera roscoffensis]|uniref:mitochondrial 2-oxoglutarate/malate carrier protein-like n=1 Tax=Symsagittifera roscoffensis TaxID=84072 RepID=UPI00307B970E